MALYKALAFISLPSLSINRSLPILPSSSSSACSSFRSLSPGFLYPLQTTQPSSMFSLSSPKQLCRAGEYVFPDPVPEFAEAETERFRVHLLKKLSKKDIFGDSLQEVVEICTEIYSKRRNRLEQKRLNALVFVKYNLQLEQRELSRRGENRNMDPICLSDMESDDEWITETEDPTLPLVEDAWAGVSECFTTQDLEATLKKPRKKSQGPRNTQIGASQSAKGKGKAVVEDDEYGYSSEEGLEDDEEEEEERGDIDEEEEEED